VWSEFINAGNGMDVKAENVVEKFAVALDNLLYSHDNRRANGVLFYAVRVEVWLLRRIFFLTVMIMY
jgi:hypothetical protein